MAITNRLSQTLIRGFRGATGPTIAASVRPLSTWLPHQQTSPSSNGILSKTRLLIYASSAATAFTFARILNSSALPFAVARADFSTSTRSISHVSKSSTPDIVLYQFEVCPFCNKVRAYLDYHGVPYRVVEVDPLRKTELKQFSEDYRKVPIAVINDKQVNGSSAVIDTVRGLMGSGKDSTNSDVEKRWLAWLDDHLIHLIAPNIYRSPSESLQTFNYITDKSKFSTWQRSTIRYTGAAAMYMIGKRLKKKYNVEDEREAIHDAVAHWMGGVREGGGKFLDGREEPGVADLSVYGVLKAIQTFDTFAEIRSRNEEFAQWFDRMKLVVGDSHETKVE